MMRVALVLALLLLGAPLAAAKLQLKTEPRAVESGMVRLEGGQATIRRAGKDSTHKLDDFTPESAYEIKRHFTPRAAGALLELARFAMHRDLYDAARKHADEAVGLDKALASEARQLTALLDMLQAESLCREAESVIEAARAVADIEKARGLLVQTVDKFPGTPGALRAAAVLKTLDQVALDLKARQLEEEARKAQAAADEETRKKRAPVDEWLGKQEAQIIAWETGALDKAEKAATGGNINDGCSQYQDLIGRAQQLRDGLVRYRDQLIYPGQAARAEQADARARKLQVECYYRWTKWLLVLKNFAAAVKTCEAGIALDPRDRRLLAQKVDIDEFWDRDAKPGGG